MRPLVQFGREAMRDEAVAEPERGLDHAEDHLHTQTLRAWSEITSTLEARRA